MAISFTSPSSVSKATVTESEVAAEKAYAYVTRDGDSASRTDGGSENDAAAELLVFEESKPDSGVQIPKGTIEDGETPREAVVRELREESGLRGFDAVRALTTDVWQHYAKPKAYRRHFFHVEVDVDRDEWRHTVTGDGDDEGVVYSYFWIRPGALDLARSMDDYVARIL